MSDNPYGSRGSQLRPGGPFFLLAPHASHGWSKLTENEKEEVRSGRCAYREHEGMPILDYTGDAVSG